MDNMDNTSNFSRGSEPSPTNTSRAVGRGTGTPSHKRIAASQVIDFMQQVQTFEQQGRFQEAIELCQQILESGFERPDVRYFLGWLYQEQHRWDDAICQFEKLLNDPDFALSCYYRLAVCYSIKGDLPKAITYFDEAVEMADLDALTFEEADDLIELVQKTAEAHYQAGEQEQAIRITRTLLNFLRSRKWSNQVVQVQFMLEHLQDGLPPRLGIPPIAAPVPSEPRKLIHFLSIKQKIMQHVSLLPFFLQRIPRPQRSPQFLHIIIVLLLIIVTFGSISFWAYARQQHSQGISATTVGSFGTAPHSTATESRTISPTPSPITSATLASSYNGVLHDIPTGITANVSLTKIQQHQNALSGYFGGMPTNGASMGIPYDGSFTGTIDPSKHIKFILTSNTGQGAFSFDGQVTADNRIVGTYCNGDKIAGKCNDYGLWSISPKLQ